jgi:uncharacterized protein (TIGR03000 family)
MKGLSRWSGACLLAVLVFSTVPALWAQDKDKDKADKGKGKDEKAGTLVVKLAEDAKLKVDGTPTKQTGAERRFSTPPLAPGKRYSYTLEATWEPNNYTTITRTRKVTIEAGKTTTLDLTKEDPKQPDHIVIRYVPTPESVVEAMLKLAKVGKDDVVYDLGCGDGRIVVTAVKKFGAKKGVGIDLDPKRIAESNANVKKEGVEGKVEIRKGDVMKVDDLGQATVVCLYLADELNEQLRPILQKTLKPGSRIVSHRFKMGDWKPEKTEKLEVAGEEYEVHLWTIADPDKEKKDREAKLKKEKEEKEKKAKEEKEDKAKEEKAKKEKEEKEKKAKEEKAKKEKEDKDKKDEKKGKDKDEKKKDDKKDKDKDEKKKDKDDE